MATHSKIISAEKGVSNTAAIVGETRVNKSNKKKQRKGLPVRVW
jgi:hypothetical protein